MLAFIIALLSLVFAWGGAALIAQITGDTLSSRSFSATDLITSGNSVAIGVILFLVGSAISILDARLSALNVVGLVVVAFTITPYESSVMAPLGTTPETMIETFFPGLGYIIAWLSALIFVAMAIPWREEKDLPAGSLSIPASEQKTYSEWLGYQRGPGPPSGP